MTMKITPQQKEILARIASLGQPQYATDLDTVFLGPKDDPCSLSARRRLALARKAERALKALDKKKMVHAFIGRPSQRLEDRAVLGAILTDEGLRQVMA